MLTLNKLLLAAATLTLGIGGIVPAEAITFDFRFTSPLPRPSYSLLQINGNGGSLTIDDQIMLGNQSGLRGLTDLNVNQGGGGGGILSLENQQWQTRRSFVSVIRLPDQWMFQGYHDLQVGTPGSNMFFMTGMSWRMNISCSLNLMDCGGSTGSSWIRLGASIFNPVSYDGGIVVNNFRLTPTPTATPTPNPNPVPEPSSVAALLLLGSVELLRRKLKAVNVLG